MQQRLAHIALVVNDYDEAIQFYTQTLSFELVEDSVVDSVADTYLPGQAKRWVLVAPPGGQSCNLLLAKATTDEQRACVGNQTGGRVFLFLQTDDFWRDYEQMRQRGVRFVREPARRPYGMVAVFADLYGNLWDLLGPDTEDIQA